MATATMQLGACSFSLALRGTHKFTGKERDTESGLDYFGFRYFGSSLGRFMSPDHYNAVLTKQGLEAGGLPADAASGFLNGYVSNPQNWRVARPLQFFAKGGSSRMQSAWDFASRKSALTYAAGRNLSFASGH